MESFQRAFAVELRTAGGVLGFFLVTIATVTLVIGVFSFILLGLMRFVVLAARFWGFDP